VLRNPYLALLWVSQVLSAVGDYFYSIAVLWIAVQEVGSQAGLVAAAQAAAALAFGVAGGVYADRWDRRRTMAAADLVRGVAVLTLPLAVLNGGATLGHFVAVAVVLGAANPFFDSSLQASLPALAGDPRTLQATNGLMDLTRRLARAVGPSLVGIVAALVPLAHFFTIDAVSFAVSAGAVLALGGRFAWAPSRAGGRRGGVSGFVEDVGEGLAALRGRPVVWQLVAMSGVAGMLWSVAFTVGVTLLAAQVLSTTIGGYGLIVGAYGAGNVAANLAVGSVRLPDRVGSYYAGRVVMGIGFVLIGLAPTIEVALAGAALAAVGGPMGDIPLMLLLQEDVPPEHRGKAFSARQIVMNAGTLAGTVAGVPLFAAIGPRAGIVACAVAFVAIGVWGLIAARRDSMGAAISKKTKRGAT